MSTIAVSDDSFENDVLKADKPVLVDFWAEWCGPCKQIGPALEEIATDMSSDIKIAKINIDENPMTPGKYGVRGIPTLMIVRGGEVVSTKIGAMAKTKIEEWIKETLVAAAA